MPDHGIWYCALCGEVMYSPGRPHRCPACGAHPRLLVEPAEGLHPMARSQEWSEEITSGGLRAIQQEVDTADLYARVASTASDPVIRAAFKALQQVETRHARLLCAVFRVRKPAPSAEVDLTGLSDAEMLELVHQREDSTIALYRSQLEVAAGTPVEQVYRALIEIEADHNDIADALAARARG